MPAGYGVGSAERRCQSILRRVLAESWCWPGVRRGAGEGGHASTLVPLGAGPEGVWANCWGCAGRDMKPPERSLEPITRADLRRLGEIARRDLESLFERRPLLARYRDRLLAIALCQGAALHYIDKKNGVKDFDVWCFFRADPQRPFPYRRNASADFGDPKFGKSADWEHYIGRRVDLLGRSLPVPAGESPVDALRAYLSAGRTASAKALAKMAMILIYPENELGRMVWPV